MSKKPKMQRLVKIGYMSEIDVFLREFDANGRELPRSRLEEVAKFKKIFAKRDKPTEKAEQLIWSGF